MTIEKRVKEEISRLKKMGYTLLGLASFVILLTYLSPLDETNYWFSRNGKDGFYILSSLFIFLGLYCLGAVWRRKHFI